MIRFLLDTNVVSEPARPRPDRNVLRHLADHVGELAITSVVWHELRFGVERLPIGKRRDYVAAYLTDVVAPTMLTLSYDAPAADWHACERARLAALGETPPFVDGMIAAIAATQGLVLVTRNVADFARFDELRLQDWFTPG